MNDNEEIEIIHTPLGTTSRKKKLSPEEIDKAIEKEIEKLPLYEY